MAEAVALRALRSGRALAVITLLALHSAAEDAPSNPAGTGPAVAEPTASLELQVMLTEAHRLRPSVSLGLVLN